MKLIIGLGNPGNEYENTRHNIGFSVIDAFLKQHKIELDKEKFNGVFYKGSDFVVAKPLTYMNKSGKFVKDIAKFFNIDIADILIIHDEINLPVAKAGLLVNGSSGNHNGIKDIMNEFKISTLNRLKIGVGFNNKFRLKDWVLSKFKLDELELLDKNMFKYIDAINCFLYNDIYFAMNLYNHKLKENE
ncbi:aminoacyl-tRNA hydrolase [Mycoplasma phocimorsus]|uniref:aminoacyl-tRNA hydrolase n=1 Tax=Mycoplasma phocimorsus TaxID=3045839 RepID=UPI0024C01C67|nr:aminoacyl-tRNA hydrolase [Mycoplasma phocimorsus]MDJ1647652.1 aminoacyl-tRNA hydrolase [Mycoplasma phocimorsus]